MRAAGQWDRTVIAFHADHGLSIGEYGTMLIKGKLLDVDCRVPFVLRVPGLPPSSYGRTAARAVVELVDVYPTLCEAARLPAHHWAGPVRLPPTAREPAYRVREATQRAALAGRSLLPLLREPGWAPAPPPRGAALSADERVAISTYPRCVGRTADWPCLKVSPSQIRVMGTSVRALRWRYVIWCEWDGAKLTPYCLRAEAADAPRVAGGSEHVLQNRSDAFEELYALREDAYDDEMRAPTHDLSLEAVNVARQFPDVVRELRALAASSWAAPAPMASTESGAHYAAVRSQWSND